MYPPPIQTTEAAAAKVSFPLGEQDRWKVQQSGPSAPAVANATANKGESGKGGKGRGKGKGASRRKQFGRFPKQNRVAWSRG